MNRLSGELPAALSVGAHSSLVELADGGGFAVGRVVREEAAAALPAHTVEEIPKTHQHTHSVCLHAQFSQITAIDRLCCSIRQLQLSEYTCRRENQIIVLSACHTRSDRWRCTHFN